MKDLLVVLYTSRSCHNMIPLSVKIRTRAVSSCGPGAALSTPVTTFLPSPILHKKLYLRNYLPLWSAPTRFLELYTVDSVTYPQRRDISCRIFFATDRFSMVPPTDRVNDNELKRFLKRSDVDQTHQLATRMQTIRRCYK